MINNIILITVLVIGVLCIYYIIKLSRIDKEKADSYYGYGFLGLIIKSLNIEVRIKGFLLILLSLYIIYKIKNHLNLIRNTNHKKTRV